MRIRYHLSDMIRHMIGSLRLRWSTTLAMIFGIGIGLAILFVSIAFACIVYASAKKGQDTVLMNKMVIGVNEAANAVTSLTAHVLDDLQATDGVMVAIPLFEITAEAGLGGEGLSGKTWPVIVESVTPADPALASARMLYGREPREHSREIVITRSLADSLGTSGEKNIVVIRLTRTRDGRVENLEHSFPVVGVCEGSDLRAYAPLALVRSYDGWLANAIVNLKTLNEREQREHCGRVRIWTPNIQALAMWLGRAYRVDPLGHVSLPRFSRSGEWFRLNGEYERDMPEHAWKTTFQRCGTRVRAVIDERDPRWKPECRRLTVAALLDMTSRKEMRTLFGADIAEVTTYQRSEKMKAAIRENRDTMHVEYHVPITDEMGYLSLLEQGWVPEALNRESMRTIAVVDVYPESDTGLDNRIIDAMRMERELVLGLRTYTATPCSPNRAPSLIGVESSDIGRFFMHSGRWPRSDALEIVLKGRHTGEFGEKRGGKVRYEWRRMDEQGRRDSLSLTFTIVGFSDTGPFIPGQTVRALNDWLRNANDFNTGTGRFEEKRDVADVLNRILRAKIYVSDIDAIAGVGRKYRSAGFFVSDRLAEHLGLMELGTTLRTLVVVMSIGGLLLSAVLVLSVMYMYANETKDEMATLKLMGVGRYDIAKLLALEAVGVGVASWMLAVLLTLAGLPLLQSLFAQTFQLPDTFAATGLDVDTGLTLTGCILLLSLFYGFLGQMAPMLKNFRKASAEGLK